MNLDFHLFTDQEILPEISREFVLHPIDSEIDVIAREEYLALTTASTSSLEFIARELRTGIVRVVNKQLD